MDQRKYIANNSANVAQGDGHANEMGAKEINIGTSFNDRKDLIQKVDEFVSLLSDQTGEDANLLKAKRQLESIKDELEEEEAPDQSAISKWLQKAKGLISPARAGAEVVSKAKELFDSFGLG